MEQRATAQGSDPNSNPAAPVLDMAALVDQLGDAIIVADQSGRILLMNAAAGRLFGEETSELVNLRLIDLMPERFREAHMIAFERFMSTGPGRLVGGPPVRVAALRSDGTEVAIELKLGAVGAPGDEGFVVVASILDMSERIQLERAVDRSRYVEASIDVAARLQVATSVEAAYSEVLPTLCTHLDWEVAALWLVEGEKKDLRCVDVWHTDSFLEGFASLSRNSVFASHTGLPGACLKLARTVAVDVERTEITLPLRSAIEAAGLHQGLAFPLVGRSEVLGVVEFFSRRSGPIDGQLLDLLTGIGRQLGQFLDRMNAEERLHAAQRSQAFLLQASDALARATTYEETLKLLAATAVPALGDLCLIDVVDEDGQIVRMAARHANPAKQPLADELQRRYPPDPAGSHPGPDVIATGRSHWSSDMSDEFLGATTRDEHHFALVKQLEFTSYVSVPLLADGRILGSLTLVSAGSGRRFGPDDVRMGEELAGRVALVVARTRRFEQELQSSHVLQSSLLPSSLPKIEGLDVSVRYLPATQRNEVGGDFYDAIAMPSQAVFLAVGDVAGHDLTAAGAMGQLRSASRALLGESSAPGVLINALERSWDLLGIERMATLLCGFLEPSTGALVLASAGHLPPIICIHGDASFIPVKPAPPLGTGVSAIEQWSGELTIGSTLVCYTDGLVERRGESIETGLDQLAEVTASMSDQSTEEVCDAILEAMVDDDRSDDVALLVVRRSGIGLH